MYYVRKANKFGAKKTKFKGRHYAGIAAEIELLKISGEVVKVEPQQTFLLFGKGGGRICTHLPEFLLTFKDGHQEVWEAKGYSIPTWQLKLKLFEDNYPDIVYYVITPRERFYGSKKRRFA